MLALRLPSFNDRPSGRPRLSAAAVLVCRHGPLPAREGRKTPSSASKAGEWRRRERLVTMDARSGPVGEGPVYCFQCHQGHCRRSLLGHRDSRTRRGTSDGGTSRSRATEGALQEPGAYGIGRSSTSCMRTGLSLLGMAPKLATDVRISLCSTHVTIKDH